MELATEPASHVDAPLAVSFQEERFEDVWTEARPLIEKHAAEVGCLKDLPLHPNLEAYAKAAEAGFTRVYTMRADRELLGYCVMCVSPHLHWSQTKWAIQDVLWVDPRYRGRKAIAFIVEIDEALAAEGVNAISRFSTNERPYGRTLERLKYRALGTTYLYRPS